MLFLEQLKNFGQYVSGRTVGFCDVSNNYCPSLRLLGVKDTYFIHGYESIQKGSLVCWNTTAIFCPCSDGFGQVKMT